MASEAAGTPRLSGPLAKSNSLEEQQQVGSYFSELLSYSLERLGEEPEYLAADQRQLAQQAQEASVAHYRAFLGLAGALSRVREALPPLRDDLEALLQGLPAVATASASFSSTAEAAAKRQGSTRQLLRQQGPVLEVLEAPALLGAATRCGAWEEALDLRAFAAKAALMHPALPVVGRLAGEAELAAQALVGALLARLGGPLQLPECLLLMGHLRRAAALPEPALRQLFLEHRERWLQGLLAQLDESRGPYDYLKRLTDVHRLHLFDVVIHYQAVFSGGAPGVFSPSGDPAGEAEEQDSHAAFCSWAEHRMLRYLEALQAGLPGLGEGGALASVLEHCMYCGASLGRVGLDFRALLPPLFEAAALHLLVAGVQEAVATFQRQLEGHRWVELAGPGGRARTPAQAPAAAAAPGAPVEPPQELLDHPPLAVFANGVAGAFNELRHCAPLSLLPAVSGLVQDALEASARGLALHWAAQSPGSSEARVFAAACRAFCSALCPFVLACIQHVYGASPAARAEKVDAERACAPLQSILQASA